MVVMVVLLLVTAGIAGAVFQAAILDARQFTFDRRAIQADRLAEAGLARAATRLQTDPGYEGEQWVAELPDKQSGIVTITVSQGDGERRIEAVATFPKDSDRPARSRRTMEP